MQQMLPNNKILSGQKCIGKSNIFGVLIQNIALENLVALQTVLRALVSSHLHSSSPLLPLAMQTAEDIVSTILNFHLFLTSPKILTTLRLTAPEASSRSMK